MLKPWKCFEKFRKKAKLCIINHQKNESFYCLRTIGSPVTQKLSWELLMLLTWDQNWSKLFWSGKNISKIQIRYISWNTVVLKGLTLNNSMGKSKHAWFLLTKIRWSNYSFNATCKHSLKQINYLFADILTICCFKAFGARPGMPDQTQQKF